MRMFNKSLISVSALLALGALGCGDNAEETPAPVNQPDSGVVGGGMDAGININGCNTLPVVGSVKLCMQPNGQNGYQTCVNNMPQGACNPISFGGTDGGAGLQIPCDAAALFDGALPQVEAGTLKCPTGTECSALAQQAGGGQSGGFSYCVLPGQSSPPSCPAAGQSCTLGSEATSCQSNPAFAVAVAALKAGGGGLVDDATAKSLVTASGVTEFACLKVCN